MNLVWQPRQALFSPIAKEIRRGYPSCHLSNNALPCVFLLDKVNGGI
jgi:hypothetical protein